MFSLRFGHLHLGLAAADVALVVEAELVMQLFCSRARKMARMPCW